MQKSLTVVQAAVGAAPFDLAVILGSGLGGVVDAFQVETRIPYADLALLPAGAVPGHAGVLCCASYAGQRLLLFQGRFHWYQGLSAAQAALPVVLARELGCRRLLLTNASGGIHPDFAPGDFMYVSDHLNYLGDNPLRSRTESPFVDLANLYQQSCFEPLQRSAEAIGCRLHRGVLAAMGGPSYETPAEIRALRLLGADAVSMSTVPEAIMARYLGLETVALAMIANRAAGLTDRPLQHDEVLACGRRAENHLRQLLLELLSCWSPLH